MLTKKDFDNIVISKKELKMLKRLSNRKWKVFSGSEYRQLASNSLIIGHILTYDEDGLPVMDGSYSITEKGLRYLDYHKKQCESAFLSEFRGWITTIVAVAALIISIISLTKQSVK